MFAAHSTVGETIGQYQVVQFLGRGSFGVVLKGQSAHNQPVALKLVPCDHLDDAEAEKTAVTTLAEAQLMQRLRHPHIVTCHEVQYDPVRKSVWLALDFMDGGDLQNMIKSRKLNGGRHFDGPFLHRVLSAVGSALCHIHSQGVLHRDVKPANVLVSRGLQEIKLADFGISKLLETSGHAGTILGTPAYMSPELVSGKPYGAPADAWAFGACLYELASLQRPFEASNQLALVWQIVEHEPATLPPETPLDVVQVIKGLLEKDPLQRLRLEDLALELCHGAQEPLPSEGSGHDTLGMSGRLEAHQTSRMPEQMGYAGLSSSGITPIWSDWSASSAVPELAPGSAASWAVPRPRETPGRPSPRRDAAQFSGGPPLQRLAGAGDSRASSEGLCDFLAHEIESPGRRAAAAAPGPELDDSRADERGVERVNTDGSDLEEVFLQEEKPFQSQAALQSPRAAGLGIAFGEPAVSSPRRHNWLSRLGRGLRYGVLGAQARDEAVVSVFKEEEVND